MRNHDAQTRITPPPTHQLSDGETMVDAPVAGLGLFQLLFSLVRIAIQRGRLNPVLRDFSTTLDLHAIWQCPAHMGPRIRYMVDQLVAYAAAGRLD